MPGGVDACSAKGEGKELKIDFVVKGEPTSYLRMTQGQVKLMMIPDRRLNSDCLAIKNRIRKRMDYKDSIRMAALAVWGNSGPTTKPIYLALKIFRKVPKGFPGPKRYLAEIGLIRPTTKPDSSNYLKIFEDALNQTIWKDDSQIVMATVCKYYGEPRAEVEVLIIGS